jgi:hypothetical protein
MKGKLTIQNRVAIPDAIKAIPAAHDKWVRGISKKAACSTIPDILC